MWLGEIADKGERSQVEGSGLSWMGAGSGGGKIISLVEGSDLRWRQAVSGRGEQAQVERSDRWWS